MVIVLNVFDLPQTKAVNLTPLEKFNIPKNVVQQANKMREKFVNILTNKRPPHEVVAVRKIHFNSARCWKNIYPTWLKWYTRNILV